VFFLKKKKKKKLCSLSEAIWLPGSDRRFQRDRVYFPGADFPRNLMRTAVIILSDMVTYCLGSSGFESTKFN